MVLAAPNAGSGARDVSPTFAVQPSALPDSVAADVDANPPNAGPNGCRELSDGAAAMEHLRRGALNCVSAPRLPDAVHTSGGVTSRRSVIKYDPCTLPAARF
jgi:hypothetical protein